ncbi:MAG: UDP-N-acetylmuramoyl-L-alanine--D-glutamate ligase, partial [Deltaproteobacteria bacterium]|nr:UDP-N-acetylmuramoyl-L-alanine--D-glutamate ligase [Deltaproteobacteria bacterium]
YQVSKLRIFQNQGPGQYAILNDDDRVLERFEPSGDVSVLRYGRTHNRKRQAFLEGTAIHATANGTQTHTFDTRKVKLLGDHNRENLMGGILAGLAMALDPRSIQRTMDHFRGLPHRLEWVGKVNDVLFVNDSKATNVDAAVKAVRSFNRQIILIAGGRHKGSDYTPLVSASKGRVKHAVFLGESREMLGRAFHNAIPFTYAGDMNDAVSKGFAAARANDVVMLAPACASFDMFTDYAHRGDVFKQAVEGFKNAG